MSDFKNLIFREFIITFKNTKSLYSYCTFFFTSMLLFVFAIGPDISILSPIYKPILWMITIFSLILISESFVSEDFLDGSLSELQFLGYSEENIFLSKCLVMFMSLIIPNIFLIPISSILFEINFLDVIELTTLFIVSLPTITLISILSAFFSLQVKRNKFIQFILTKYIEGGVEELGIDRLSDLLELKYQGVLEGQQVLGNIDSIKKLFIDFQKHLY